MASPGSGPRIVHKTMRYWEPAKIWEGRTAVVLASGPSMTREVAQTVHDADVMSIAVNNQAIDTNGLPAMSPWADILFAGDFSWWFHNRAAIAEFKGMKVSLDSENHRWTTELLEQVIFLRHGGVDGFDERLGYLRTGGNSGYMALHLALTLGAKRVVLCGFDMHSKNGEHWFGGHHWRVDFKSKYDLFLNRFKSSAKQLQKQGEIINATPDSALKCFPMMTLEDALDGVRGMRRATAQSESRNESGGSRAQETVGTTSKRCAS
jgi:hypothetical protein